ncbi:MAG: dihydrodipicolinate reductase [Chlamydiia bacterium]|nr:dihydrodipicolinate reductase [Chlamydiia bacterium]
MKIALLGYGKMNQLVEKLALARGDVIVSVWSSKKQEGELKTADIAIDFSSHQAVLSHLEICQKNAIPLVIGTTGWDVSTGRTKVSSDGAATLFSPNFSVGVFLFFQVIKKAASLFEDRFDYQIRGIETHHKQKKDAPSGTAKALTSLFKRKMSFESLRIDHHPGKHEVIFESSFDTIQLIHEAHSREGFASGALIVADWLIGKKGWRTFEEVFND